MIRRPPRSPLFPYTTRFRSLAVRNTRVLARATVGLVRRGEPAPGLLSEAVLDLARAVEDLAGYLEEPGREQEEALERDRKSTRLNSSHANISYAVFCLKKKY